jgi:DNA/RNA-binding domain of Phe-tRNA-synthetase-like protein
VTAAVSIAVAPHPLLDVGAFVTRLPAPIRELVPRPLQLPEPGEWLPSDEWLSNKMRAEVSELVRKLLRHGGYKPAGRGKPASEYLLGAAREKRFPVINPVVDLCNHFSLSTQLPISLVDLDLATPPLSIAIAPRGTTYVFNASGQVIDASGLLVLFDAHGPTGTPVKDAQRTKTHPDTRTTLTIVWGTIELPSATRSLVESYGDVLRRAFAGASVEDVILTT